MEGIRSITDLETAELLNLSKTLNARLKLWNERRELAALLRSIIAALALYGAWPARSIQSAPPSAPCTAFASAVNTFFNPIAATLPEPNPALFFSAA